MPQYLRLGSIPRKHHIAHRACSRIQERGNLLRGSGHDGRIFAGLQRGLPPSAADASDAARARRDRSPRISANSRRSGIIM